MDNLRNLVIHIKNLLLTGRRKPPYKVFAKHAYERWYCNEYKI